MEGGGRGQEGAGKEVGGTLGHQCPRLAQIKIEEAGRDKGLRSVERDYGRAAELIL